MSERLPYENGRCVKCGRFVASYVPKGGDGSLRRAYRHMNLATGEWCTLGEVTFTRKPAQVDVKLVRDTKCKRKCDNGLLNVWVKTLPHPDQITEGRVFCPCVRSV